MLNATKSRSANRGPGSDWLSVRFATIALLGVAAFSANAPHPARASMQHLYVVSGPTVNIFPLNARGNAGPERVLTASETSPSYSIAVDQNGYLYAPQQALGAVYVYGPQANGNARPVRVIRGSRTMLRNPFGVVLDNAGYIYISDPGSSQIDVFSPGARGNVAPIRTISGAATQLTDSSGYLAVDGRGHIFVELGGVFGAALGWEFKQFRVLEFGKNAVGNIAPIARFAPAPSGTTKPENISVFSNLLYVSAFTGDNIGGVVDIYHLPDLSLIQVLNYPPFARRVVYGAVAAEDGTLRVLMGNHFASVEVFAPNPSIPGGVMTEPESFLGGPQTGFDNGASEDLVIGR